LKSSFFHFLHRLGLIPQANASLLNSIFTISLLILPFGYMTVKGVFGILAAICLILALLILIIDTKSVSNFFNQKYSLLIVFALLAIVLSIFIGQTIRGRFILDAYDGPSRLIFALPILIAIYKLKIDFGKILSLSLPLALLAILIYAKSGTHSYGDRLTTHYLDPIFWGNFSIIMGLMCLASIKETDSVAMKLYRLSGLGLGVTMSILSQSRAGWVAAVALIVIWLFINRKQLTLKKLALYSLLTIAAIITLYLTVNTFQSRIDTAISEVINWSNKTQTESATGYRLTMWKMTAHFFSLSPWFGHGEYTALPILNDTYIQSFADAESIKTIQCCGPHNEIAAQILRSGLLGITALLATYFIPAYIFARSKSHQSKSMGVILCMGIFICGFGTEMLGLKISYTFYALLLAGLLATSLWKSHEQK
jgi:O-antigen ligase